MIWDTPWVETALAFTLEDRFCQAIAIFSTQCTCQPELALVIMRRGQTVRGHLQGAPRIPCLQTQEITANLVPLKGR